MLKNGMRPIHPGEVLREEFLVPLEMSVNALALALNVPATRLHEIVKERRGITADTAYRLARYFDTSPEFWLNLQAAYDLKTLPTRSGIDRKVEPRERTHRHRPTRSFPAQPHQCSHPAAQRGTSDTRYSPSPISPPTSVPLMRMYCRSLPMFSSICRDISRASQLRTVSRM